MFADASCFSLHWYAHFTHAEAQHQLLYDFFFFSIEGLLIMLPEFGMQGQAAWSHTGKCFTPQPGKVILVAKNLNNIKIILNIHFAEY